ncbi:MAG: hypothetical protein M1828_001983 [Chrysothrix sp. TS-e1954]|nr:MAG: hypothetical protein M1828_001983 [Chrysothrix sp. TS-e1954]
MTNEANAPMRIAVQRSRQDEGEGILDTVLQTLTSIRKVKYEVVDSQMSDGGVPMVDETLDFAATLASIASALKQSGHPKEAEALARSIEHCTDDKRDGGWQISTTTALDKQSAEKIKASIEAWLSSLNAAEQTRRLPMALKEKPAQRKPMTLAQKIFAHHAIGAPSPDELAIGDVVRFSCDWVMASELSYVGMKKTMDQFDSPQVWRNDRFWLAGDHVIDPRNYNTELSRKLIGASDKIAKEQRLTDYKGPNYTIMHTEFVRARAEPGMLVIGSDSHTCSSGAVGALAIGLGAADVVMPLITGETWFKVPEVVNVRFVGEPAPGIGGKDTILHILGELKRNTVAAERIVEFSGPGMKYLSTDARFAISNMCTEFGAITGVFVPDATTQEYISSRKQKNRKSSALYFQPDEGAPYAGVYDIDLSKVQSFYAVYPNPDDVVPVKEKAGEKLDGVFIGACTTALEDLILAAMLLQVGIKKGLKQERGKRHVVPGSLPVGRRLEELGLKSVFAEAGFEMGVPGCSFCVGMGSDQAQEGETWLSSQNRNFQNRMGKGSFGNLASAATVAASSFSMTVTDPKFLLDHIDYDLFDKYRRHSHKRPSPTAGPDTSAQKPVQYVEPALIVNPGTLKSPARASITKQTTNPTPKISSKIIRLGDYIDTDALAPAQYLALALSDEDMGTHCLEFTHPEFRSKAKDQGHQVIVAGHAFGVGSSREEAVRAIQGNNVKCVIARSFAFIYGRNQPNLGLLGITIQDDEFYELATEGAEIEIDVEGRVAKVGGKQFTFPLTDIEISLLGTKGIAAAYKMYGKAVFERLTGGDEDTKEITNEEQQVPQTLEELQW